MNRIITKYSIITTKCGYRNVLTGGPNVERGLKCMLHAKFLNKFKDKTNNDPLGMTGGVDNTSMEMSYICRVNVTLL